jgi:hypothetical protein
MLVVSLYQRSRLHPGVVDHQPWDFSFITSGLSVLGHSWNYAHARSETEVMTSLSRSVCVHLGD